MIQRGTWQKFIDMKADYAVQQINQLLAAQASRYPAVGPGSFE
jgi:hypothetical protein